MKILVKIKEAFAACSSRCLDDEVDTQATVREMCRRLEPVLVENIIEACETVRNCALSDDEIKIYVKDFVKEILS